MDDQTQALARLTKIDEKIMAVRHNQRDIPRRVEELEAEIAQETRLVDEKKARKEELAKQRRDLERALAEIETKITADREKELKVRTNEELHALQREVKMAREKQGDIEEKVLLVMEEVAEFDKEVARAEKRLAEFKGRIEGEIGTLKQRLDADEKEIDSHTSDREAALDVLDARTRKRYEGLAGRGLLPAVARVRDGVCTGCHTMLQPQLYNQVIAGDEIYHCQNCGRLLIYFEEEES